MEKRNLTPTVLVTGGTGTLGRLVASRLLEAGCDVRVLSRSARAPQKGIRFITGNLLTREGAVSAVDGVAAIVHCASGTKGDVEATRNLTMAASSLAVAPHLVYVSIVGVDQLSWGYMKSKLEAEGVVAESGLPWTIQRHVWAPLVWCWLRGRGTQRGPGAKVEKITGADQLEGEESRHRMP